MGFVVPPCLITQIGNYAPRWRSQSRLLINLPGNARTVSKGNGEILWKENENVEHDDDDDRFGGCGGRGSGGGGALLFT